MNIRLNNYKYYFFGIIILFFAMLGVSYIYSNSNEEKGSNQSYYCHADSIESIIPGEWKEEYLHAESTLYQNVFSKEAKDVLLKPKNVTHVPDFISGSLAQQESAIDSGRVLVLKDQPSINIKEIDWGETNDGNYFATQLHSFAGLGSLLESTEKLSDKKESAISEVIRSWAICNQNPENFSDRAWYEGTVIKRLSNLLKALNYQKLHGTINGLSYEELMYLILLQVDYLINEDVYTTGNHGLRQDLMLASAAIAIPTMPNTNEIFNLVNKRLYGSAQTLFTDGGIWSEHAPGYIDYALVLMIDLQLLNDKSKKLKAKPVLRKIEPSGEYLLASLTPDMQIPWIGSSGRTEISSSVIKELESNGINFDKKFRKNFNTIRFYDDYGHAIMRGKDHTAPYVVFYAAQNLPAGKRHEDALSFISFNLGRAWFIEAGHNTYEPGPLTKYVRTAKAHNTYTYDNEIINESSKPELTAGLTDYSESNNQWIVSGFSERFNNNARVERTLKVKKDGSQINIEDNFYKEKNSGACFQGYFQFPNDLKINIEKLNEIKITSLAPQAVMTITDKTSSLSKVKVSSGQKDPYLGWGFDGDEFGPIQTLSYEVCDTENLELIVDWEHKI